jgi:hypothetical protein
MFVEQLKLSYLSLRNRKLEQPAKVEEECHKIFQNTACVLPPTVFQQLQWKMLQPKLIDEPLHSTNSYLRNSLKKNPQIPPMKLHAYS